MSDIILELNELNNPRIGSFGEYLFETVVITRKLGTIKSLHKNGVDYKFKGKNVDVGTTRKFHLGTEELKRKEITNKQVAVIFMKEYCGIFSSKKYLLQEIKLSYEEISIYYSNWVNGHRNVIKKAKHNKYDVNYKKIKEEIINFFISKNINTRIIYRTNTKRFGLKESPHNLLPKTQIKNKTTVYIDFKDFKRKKDNINFILAFPDSYKEQLPKLPLKKVRLGNFLKVDLMEIIKEKEKGYFENIEQLINEYEKSFPIKL